MNFCGIKPLTEQENVNKSDIWVGGSVPICKHAAKDLHYY